MDARTNVGARSCAVLLDTASFLLLCGHPLTLAMWYNWGVFPPPRPGLFQPSRKLEQMAARPSLDLCLVGLVGRGAPIQGRGLGDLVIVGLAGRGAPTQGRGRRDLVFVGLSGGGTRSGCGRRTPG